VGERQNDHFQRGKKVILLRLISVYSISGPEAHHWPSVTPHLTILSKGDKVSTKHNTAKIPYSNSEKYLYSC